MTFCHLYYEISYVLTELPNEIRLPSLADTRQKFAVVHDALFQNHLQTESINALYRHSRRHSRLSERFGPLESTLLPLHRPSALDLSRSTVFTEENHLTFGISYSTSYEILG